uniref:Reverse transcriptase zinc-binding domain-containing protein n=1 Tax=Manihot esculenta TaxID=3983 RepID=A0A2C9UQM4_MANES
MLRVKEVAGFTNYLDFPAIVGRNKTSIIHHVVDKRWNRNILSRAGKEILLKTVILAVPNYLMQVFLLPLRIADQLEKAMNWFWWVNFSAGSTALVSRVYKARYFHKCGFLKAKLGSNPSFIWKSILASQELLRRGCLKRIGSGAETLVFSDPWISSLQGFQITSTNNSGVADLVVVDIRGEDNLSWDNKALHSLFSSEEKAAILRIPVSYTTIDDSWFWLEEGFIR